MGLVAGGARVRGVSGFGVDGAGAANCGELGNGGIVDGGEFGVAFDLRLGLMENDQISVTERKKIDER